MAFSPDAIANYFLDRATEAGVEITPMKLQKLVYYAQGWHLAFDPEGRPLVSDKPQAWDFGPVFPSLYHEFKDFGNRPITRKAVTPVDDDGNLTFVEPSIDQEAKSKRYNAEFAKAILDRVFDSYGKLPAVRLSEMTHVEGSPWSMIRKAAAKRFLGGIPRGLEIPDTMIRGWFREKLVSKEPA